MKNMVKFFGNPTRIANAAKVSLVIIAIVALIGFMAACSDDGDDFNPGTAVYRGADAVGNNYVLTVTEKDGRASYKSAAGDSYELTITYKDGTKNTSKGTVNDVKSDGTFELAPSGAGASTFSIVIDNDQISSVVGEIAVVGGGVILPSTFNTIYLRANRWGGLPPNHKSYGEQWSTGLCVNLLDFVDDLKTGIQYSITLKGTIDNALEHTNIEVWSIPSGKISDWLPSNKWIGGSNGFVSIPRGKFETTHSVAIHEGLINLDNNGKKQIWLQFTNVFLYVDDDGNVIDDFGRIPEHIPNGTIMATISDFSVEIVENGYVPSEPEPNNKIDPRLHGEWEFSSFPLELRSSFTLDQDSIIFNVAGDISMPFEISMNNFTLLSTEEWIDDNWRLYFEQNNINLSENTFYVIFQNKNTAQWSTHFYGLFFIYVCDPHDTQNDVMFPLGHQGGSGPIGVSGGPYKRVSP